MSPGAEDLDWKSSACQTPDWDFFFYIDRQAEPDDGKCPPHRLKSLESPRATLS